MRVVQCVWQLNHIRFYSCAVLAGVAVILPIQCFVPVRQRLHFFLESNPFHYPLPSVAIIHEFFASTLSVLVCGSIVKHVLDRYVVPSSRIRCLESTEQRPRCHWAVLGRFHTQHSVCCSANMGPSRVVEEVGARRLLHGSSSSMYPSM